MDEDAGVRWLTQSKTAIGYKEQWHKQHHENRYRESLTLENIWKKDEGGSTVLILLKLVVSGFKILRKKVLVSYFIVVVACNILYIII